MQIRRTSLHRGLLLCFLINLLLNFEWTVPAWICLGLYLWLRNTLFLWLMLGAFGLYILITFCFTAFLSSLSRHSTPDTPKENKNPYSAKN